MHTLPRALTLDLDDTLWPIAPTIERAETVLHDWLGENAPATAQRYDRVTLRALREEVSVDNPHLLHDLSALRLECLRRALRHGGDDEALASPAFDVFFAARQQVVFYDEVLAVLERLAQRFPLLALTNGNADLERIGLSRYFRGSVTARSAGVAKPDPRIFLLACEQLGCAPHEVLHVGDDYALDVVGAVQAGLQAAWVCREGALAHGEGYRSYASLSELAEVLKV